MDGADSGASLGPTTMRGRTYGSKYERGLSVSDITGRIRKDIAAAKKDGRLPKGNYSVRTPYRKCIHITVVSLAEYVQVYRDKAVLGHDYRSGTEGPYTPAMRYVLKTLESLADAYNYKGEARMDDSYDDSFHAFFRVDESVEESDKMRLAAECADTDVRPLGGWQPPAPKAVELDEDAEVLARSEARAPLRLVHTA